MTAIELFCGMFGGTAGWLQMGRHAIGFDLSHEPYHGPVPKGAELVLQDVLTLHGSQFKDAAYIWASPPCTQYSYLAMPWSRSTDPNNSKAAKELRRKWETEGPDNRLFDACFRIQREAMESAGRFIPLIVENVRGAQPWVGKAKANYGSFFLWGNVAQVGNRIYVTGADGMPIDGGLRVPAKAAAQKNSGGSWFGINGSGRNESRNDPRDSGVKVASESGRRTDVGNGTRFTSRDCGIEAGTKIGGDWFSDPKSTCRKHGSKSNARKAASALIAKIPLPLSRYVAQAVNRLRPDLGLCRRPPTPLESAACQRE